jgi:hypothetical protein
MIDLPPEGPAQRCEKEKNPQRQPSGIPEKKIIRKPRRCGKGHRGKSRLAFPGSIAIQP